MKKKLFIISRNNISIDFWSNVIEHDDIGIWKWKDFNFSMINKSILFPDAIVVDDYFLNADNDQWIKKVVKMILATGYKQQVYCLSPTYLDRDNIFTSTIPNAMCHSFDQEFIENLNNSLEFDGFAQKIIIKK